MRRRSRDDEAAEQARREQEAREQEVINSYGRALERASAECERLYGADEPGG